VIDERVFELVGEAEVIHHQPAGLVAEDTVPASPMRPSASGPRAT
jgi:hypothetical protein